MSLSTKKILAAGVILVIIFGVAYLYFPKETKAPTPVAPEEKVVPVEIPDPKISQIGTSVEGRAIEAYTFGEGEKEVVLVGGLHGGYEWNSAYLTYKFIDYFTENPELLPEDIKITIIPSANPDGMFKITGKDGRFVLADIPTTANTTGVGRFNARGVDLNRNFDCQWQPESTWRGQVVDAGTAPFSEPEARAIRDFSTTNKPSVMVFFHSQANALYSSACGGPALTETTALVETYATASGYPAHTSFDNYTITGDAGDWLSSVGIPALSIELSTHDTIDWEKNLAGVKALLKSLSS